MTWVTDELEKFIIENEDFLLTKSSSEIYDKLRFEIPDYLEYVEELFLKLALIRGKNFKNSFRLRYRPNLSDIAFLLILKNSSNMAGEWVIMNIRVDQVIGFKQVKKVFLNNLDIIINAILDAGSLKKYRLCKRVVEELDIPIKVTN